MSRSVEKKLSYIFDLSGVILIEDILPAISRGTSIESAAQELVASVKNEDIPYIESVVRMAFLVGDIPLSELRNRIKSIPRRRHIIDFIERNADSCTVVTEMPFEIVSDIFDLIPCQSFASKASVDNDRLNKVTSILRKENIVQGMKASNNRVVFIGHNNDAASAMAEADISIAVGLSTYPGKSATYEANYVIFDEETLCHQLYQLS